MPHPLPGGAQPAVAPSVFAPERPARGRPALLARPEPSPARVACTWASHPSEGLERGRRGRRQAERRAHDDLGALSRGAQPGGPHSKPQCADSQKCPGEAEPEEQTDGDAPFSRPSVTSIQPPPPLPAPCSQRHTPRRHTCVLTSTRSYFAPTTQPHARAHAHCSTDTHTRTHAHSPHSTRTHSSSLIHPTRYTHTVVYSVHMLACLCPHHGLLTAHTPHTCTLPDTCMDTQTHITHASALTH